MENLTLSLRQRQTSYEYTHIPNENTIRILTLFPGLPNTRLEGRLEFANLADSPKYEAISYVWGDPTRCDEISIDGTSLRLTQSISDALQRIRHEDKPRIVWADQVCINQDDLTERGHQVKLMGQIYQNTTRVLAWLGRDEHNFAAPALEKFKSLEELFDDENRLKQFTEDQKERLKTFDGSAWRPLRRFYFLPWFTRVWVGQEAGTGAPMTLFWGEEELDWKTVIFVSGTLSRLHKPLRHRFLLRPRRVQYLHKRFVAPSNIYQTRYESFVYELDQSRRKAATDPRDRIYAKLGHFSAAVLLQSPPSFEADYTRSTIELYTDVAHCNDEENLPSWVPDWGNRSNVNIISVHGDWFRAAGERTPSFNIEEGQRILEAKGLDIDEIKISSERLGKSDFDFKYFQSDVGTSGHITMRLWNDICQLSNFGLEDLYINGESAVLAFCQTLTAGCKKFVSRYKTLHRNYHSMPSDTWLQHGAAYLTRIFGDAGLVDEDIKKAGEGGDAFVWNECALFVCGSRSFFRTEKGYYGLGPSEVQQGDVIVVLFGGTTPYVLRPNNEEGFTFVGECYVYGLMNGEAIAMMERGELTEKTFVIR
ncbi:heterokaryon incompatibility protein-domain-containing protein [Cadophora sp. MPI-SDFR-AT-0126]|nr:heterokaryon incompatibility protein-domain-containing protein [Leotiomycetes sp. MPI-SDFR-AT-0126]